MKNQEPGLPVLYVPGDVINKLYHDKEIDIGVDTREFDKRYRFNIENEYFVLTNAECESQSAIGRVSNGTMKLVKVPQSVSGLKPRNKEQIAALDALLDNSIQVVALSGTAGGGKTLLTLAAAVELITASDTQYNKLILTRPMSWVGKYSLGAMPGDVNEKFAPYLQNYMCNLEYLFDKSGASLQDVVAQLRMEFVPIQLLRGASWSEAIVIADEIQILDHEEMVALGTRIGENSKLILMGDLGQRDEKIAREKTGLYKFINSSLTQTCEFAAHVELVTCERGPVAALFANVFGV